MTDSSDAWDGSAHRRRSRWALVWLVALVMANVHLFGGVGVRHAGTEDLLVVAAFEAVAAAVGMIDAFSPPVWWQRRPLPMLAGSVALLWASAGVLAVVDGAGWLYLVVFAVLPTIRAGLPFAQAALPLSALYVAIFGIAIGEQVGNIVGNVGSVLGCSAVTFGFSRLIRANRALQQAQEERAVVAVSEERMRFARDLHDLLGHSLSVIALKSELAGRLFHDAPEEASAEVAEIERVARDALREVREAVTGYRRPTLAVELAGARTALAAAGITWHIDGGDISLAPEGEGVLAWCVREGVTNVIRHSQAATCKIRVTVDAGNAAVAVTDDGVAPEAEPAAGNGLSGLAERVAQVGGTMEAGPDPTGGYRLRVSVPQKTSAVQAPTSQAPTSQAPASQLPTSQAPASQLPAGHTPASRLPTSHTPASRLPAGPGRCR